MDDQAEAARDAAIQKARYNGALAEAKTLLNEADKILLMARRISPDINHRLRVDDLRALIDRTVNDMGGLHQE